jgi:hypothetical protein
MNVNQLKAITKANDIDLKKFGLNVDLAGGKYNQTKERIKKTVYERLPYQIGQSFFITDAYTYLLGIKRVTKATKIYMSNNN